MQFLPIVQSFFSSSFESYLWLIWVTRWCHWNESYIFISYSEGGLQPPRFYLVHFQTALQNCVKSYTKWRHHPWCHNHYDVIIHLPSEFGFYGMLWLCFDLCILPRVQKSRNWRFSHFIIFREIEVESTKFEMNALSEAIGVPVQALTLVGSLFASYPLAFIHR